MMKTMKNEFSVKTKNTVSSNDNLINNLVKKSWSRIAPFWPLKNLIAVNPIAGFEDLPFEKALKEANAYFQQKDMPEGMQQVNRQTIKWLQVFFDEGQTTIKMPYRNQGLLNSLLSLFIFDTQLHQNDLNKQAWIKSLPCDAEKIIIESLHCLNIVDEDKEQFLTLALTTLPGWACHIKYRANWTDHKECEYEHSVKENEYLAVRLILMCLIWPNAKELLSYHRKAIETSDVSDVYNDVVSKENAYQERLIKQLNAQKSSKKIKKAEAQLVFCIDVRSESFRRALEMQGSYETYSIAGFFGVPVSVENNVTGDRYASCPVLLKPMHNVIEYPHDASEKHQNGYKNIQLIYKVYHAVKYTFTTPLSLVETMGFASGVWMVFRNFIPRASEAIQSFVKKTIASCYVLSPDVDSIPFDQQVVYAFESLTIMGLTDNFSSLIVFCGHGSSTQNNVYATALDCGACGGHHGGANARILAAILNSEKVRDALLKKGIKIGKETVFLAGEHNTTTDEVVMYESKNSNAYADQIKLLKDDLKKARNQNSFWRAQKMNLDVDIKNAYKETALRSKDWAQIRPEWGLSGNASFIIGPRSLTKDVDLDGRSFLHSYDWQKDLDGIFLEKIMTAPMVVAQWINLQYFFSTLDNIAYGGGSKVTKNITGNVGIMQGNASDLMHGLPLQSVFESDDKPYHESMRLLVVIYASQSNIDLIIKKHKILQKLFGNAWIHLICYDPESNDKLRLQKDFTWVKIN